MIESPDSNLPSRESKVRDFAFMPGRRAIVTWAVALLGLPLIMLAEERSFPNAYVILVLQIVGIYAIEAMGLGLINGFTGQFSLGHATFMGVGAYTSAVLTSRAAEMPFLPALVVGGLAAALVALLLGLPVFRLKGDYVVVITLAINLIFVNLMYNIDYTGGPTGLTGIQPFSTLAWIYAWVIVTYVVLKNLVFSTHGRAMLSVRDDETAASLVGINPYRYKIISFTIACFFAGIGGGLFAHTIMFISPANFTLFVSIDILVMTLLGGTGSLFGAAIGALILRVVLEALRPLGLWRMLVTPLLLLLLMFFRPNGVYGLREPSFLRDRWDDHPIRAIRRRFGEARARD